MDGYTDCRLVTPEKERAFIDGYGILSVAFFVLAACRFLEGDASHDPTPGTCALVEIVWVPFSDPRVASGVAKVTSFAGLYA